MKTDVDTGRSASQLELRIADRVVLKTGRSVTCVGGGGGGGGAGGRAGRRTKIRAHR